MQDLSSQPGICSAKTVGTQPELSDLAVHPRIVALEVLKRIDRLERNTFPRKEAFDFSPAILNKRNTTVMFMTSSGSAKDDVIAYAVLTRFSRTLLLHKLCVASGYRGKGIGKIMVSVAIQQARQGKCRSVELWVDPNRRAAHRLYQSAGFIESQKLPGYYSDGRDGVKMILSIDG